MKIVSGGYYHEDPDPFNTPFNNPYNDPIYTYDPYSPTPTPPLPGPFPEPEPEPDPGPNPAGPGQVCELFLGVWICGEPIEPLICEPSVPGGICV